MPNLGLPKHGLAVASLDEAEAILSGRKTMVVKRESLDVDGRDVFLVHGNMALGVWKLDEPQRMSGVTLDGYGSQTLLRSDERRRLWPDDAEFFVYKAEVLEVFEAPMVVAAPANDAFVVPNVEVSSAGDAITKAEWVMADVMLGRVLARVESWQDIEKAGKVEETGSSFRARLRDPGLFVRLRTTTIQNKPLIRATTGPLKSDPSGSAKLQSLIFPKSEDWTMARVREWLAAHPDIRKATWTTAFVNDLPDSSFFYIAPGGKKDADGKTVPRSLRKLPYRDANGKVDLPHLRNALARLSSTQGIPADEKDRIRAKAQRLLASATGVGKAVKGSDVQGWTQLLFKAEENEERFVLGIVLVPEEEDLQGDIYSEEEVRKAAHYYMENDGDVGLQHREMVSGEVKVLENYLAPVEFEMNGTKVKKGTWLQGLRVVSDRLWKAVKSGELTGLSIGGSSFREPEAA